jgi:hypothetical protein
MELTRKKKFDDVGPRFAAIVAGLLILAFPASTSKNIGENRWPSY